MNPARLRPLRARRSRRQLEKREAKMIRRGLATADSRARAARIFDALGLGEKS